MRSKKEPISFPPAKEFKLEQIGPGKFVPKLAEVTDRAMVRVPATREMIVERITYLRGWANGMITQEGRDPARYMDIIRESRTGAEEARPSNRAKWAASVLERLNDIEREFARVEQEIGYEEWERAQIERRADKSMRRSVYNAIFYALMLSTDVHWLTCADNQSGIDHQISLKESREKAKARTSRAPEHARWNRAARWTPGLSKAKVAKAVKKALGLEHEVPTIAKRLKKPRTVS